MNEETKREIKDGFKIVGLIVLSVVLFFLGLDTCMRVYSYAKNTATAEQISAAGVKATATFWGGCIAYVPRPMDCDFYLTNRTESQIDVNLGRDK